MSYLGKLSSLNSILFKLNWKPSAQYRGMTEANSTWQKESQVLAFRWKRFRGRTTQGFNGPKNWVCMTHAYANYV